MIGGCGIAISPHELQGNARAERIADVLEIAIDEEIEGAQDGDPMHDDIMNEKTGEIKICRLM